MTSLANRIWAGATFAAMALLSSVSGAQPASDYYKGKQLVLYVGDTAGSGYTSYAQVVQRHLSKHLPGHPSVIIKLMPGAGSVIAANYLAEVAPKDGTAIAALYRQLATEPLMKGKDSKVKFDPRKMAWLYSLNSETSVALAWHATGFKGIDDLRAREFLVPSGGAAGNAAVFGSLMNDLAGTRFKMVCCYQGSAAQDLAIERGEVDGRLNFSWDNLMRTRADWVKDGKVNLLFQFALERHPELPNLPLALDFIKAPEDRKVMEIVLTMQSIGRPYAAPPGVSSEVAAMLRAAFHALLKDEDFVADARKNRLELSEPMPGQKINDLIAGLFDVSEATLTKLRAAFQTEAK